MAVCPYYQQGTCKFGDRCRNEHPGSQRDGNRSSGGGGFGGGSNNNRFSAFNGGDRYRPSQSSGGTFGAGRDTKTLPYHLDKSDMKMDLTDGRPYYPLSCYGPGRDAPRQLIEGPVEISPEELRLRYYTLRAAGNEPTAQQEELALFDKMQQQVKAILDNFDGAIQYIEEGANIHPNRIDLAKGTVSSNAPAIAVNVTSNSSGNPFLKAPATTLSPGSSTQSSAFGQTSTPGFGRPAFGQPSSSAQTTSAFGQPSNSGQNTSPFGMTSSLGQKPSPFGQPSALGAAGAFGKPAFGASGFGQPSMPGSGSAFGQTSSLGQGPAFGQPSAPGTTPAFGQANALGQKPSPFSNPGFGQSGFAQVSQPGASASPFGQQAQSNASPFGQQAQSNASPFGQQAQSNASPFGQQAQSNASPFGQQAQSNASPFGQQTQQGTQAPPFAQQAQQAQKPNPFVQGQSQQLAAQTSPFGGVASSQTSAFGQPSAPALGPSPFGKQSQNTSAQPPNPFLKAHTAASGTTAALSGFNAQSQAASPLSQTQAQPRQPVTTPAQQAHPVTTAVDGKIDAKDRFKEGKPEEYEGEQGKLLEEIYRRVGQLGRFNDDEDIPIVPPKCEWIVPVAML